jgi:hypothetical protein
MSPARSCGCQPPMVGGGALLIMWLAAGHGPTTRYMFWRHGLPASSPPGGVTGSRLIALPDGIGWVVTFLAAARIGAVAIPTNPALRPAEHAAADRFNARQWIAIDDLLAAAHRIHPDDVSFSISKLYFAYSFGNSLVYPLHTGSSAVLLPAAPAPEFVAEVVDRYQVSVLHGAPSAPTASKTTCPARTGRRVESGTSSRARPRSASSIAVVSPITSAPNTTTSDYSSPIMLYTCTTPR